MSENITLIIEEGEHPIGDTIDQNLNEIKDLFSNKKKKKKVKNLTDNVSSEKINEEKFEEKNDFTNLENLPCCDPPEYTYLFLLNRIYENLDGGNTSTRNKFIIKMPIVQRLGAKKTGWINFIECAKNLNRESEHLKCFILSELSTEASIDGNGYLLLRGIFNQKTIESLLRKYTIAYVQCTVCKGLDTSIQKNNITRLNFLVCSTCKSSQSIQPINTLYKTIGKKK